MAAENPYYYNTRRGEGGEPYSDEETKYALERRLDMPTAIPLEEKDLYPRIATGLDMTDILYLGRWTNQGKENTCGVWGVVNAMRSIGGEPSVPFVKGALNYAISHDLEGEENGISFNTTFGMALFHGIDAKVQRILPQDNLEHLPMVPYAEDPTGAALIGKNARIVTQHVTGDSAMVIRVPGYRMRKGVWVKRPHAICLAGYRVDEDGFMDVQVIDSAKGVSYKGIEALSRQLYVDSAMGLVVSRKSKL